MGYNFNGWGFIESNTTKDFNFEFGSGDDVGAQYMQAIPESNEVTLTTTGWSIDRNVDGVFTYRFTVTNSGQRNTTFTLGGGGF